MASKKQTDSPVVKVFFNTTTRYGRRGTYGYIPKTFSKAWDANGIVEIVKSNKSDHVEEVADEVDSEGQSTGDSTGVLGSIYEGTGE